jgi:hypothetical protein
MRRMALVTTMAVAAVLLIVPSAFAEPLPPPAVGGLPAVAKAPENLLLGMSPYQGSGTRALDGSISSAGTFFNFPVLGSGTYAYDLGPELTVPPEFAAGVPGGKLQDGTGLLTGQGGSQTFDLLCNPLLRECLWHVPFSGSFDVYSKSKLTFVGRGGGFTETGFFHKFGPAWTAQRG